MDFFFKPLASLPAGHERECWLKTLLHWLNFSDPEAPSAYYPVYGLHVSKFAPRYAPTELQSGFSRLVMNGQWAQHCALHSDKSLPNDTEKRAEVEPSIRRPALITVYGRITPSSCSVGLHLSFTHLKLALHFLLQVTSCPRPICFSSPLYNYPSLYLCA